MADKIGAGNNDNSPLALQKCSTQVQIATKKNEGPEKKNLGPSLCPPIGLLETKSPLLLVNPVEPVHLQHGDLQRVRHGHERGRQRPG